MTGSRPADGRQPTGTVPERRTSAPPTGLLASLLDAVDHGILVEDQDRRVLVASAALGTLFGVTLDLGRLAGTRLADHHPYHSTEEPHWARLVAETRDAVDDRHEVHLPGGRVVQRGYRPITVDGQRYGHLWTFREVTEAARARRELAERDLRLQELTLLKARFFSVVAHELRTPLTSIVTFTEMLTGQSPPQPDELVTGLSAIQRNTERMLTLLEDLALLAQLESGEAGPVAQRGAVDLVPLVDAAAALLHALAPGLTPHVQVVCGPAVCGDPRLIREVLLTMAGAAAAFTSGGEVYVSAFTDGTEWTVTMSVTEAEVVTNELLLGTRLPAADPATPGRSVALALLLARAIATNQGGTLTTSSDTPHNLTLVLHLPILG